MISAPEPFTSRHKTNGFDCGNETLNEWLLKRALKNQKTGSSRTFVICSKNRVIGYYALATGSIERLAVPKSIARNTPESIPVIVLGRLAVDLQYQKRYLGSSLLKNALLRTLTVSINIGVRAILVHAISEAASKFYQSHGFKQSPTNPMVLMLSVQSIKVHF